MRNYLHLSTSLKVASIVGAAALLAAAVGQASASTISFDFATTPGQLLDSQVFSSTTTPTIKVTATGFNKQSTQYNTHETDLYYKSTTNSAAETGLGLANGPDHEIGHGQFIQLDLTNVLANLPAGNNPVTITIGSVQKSSGDAYAIYSSNTAGTLGSDKVASGNWTSATGSIDTATFSLIMPGANPYLDITETGFIQGSDDNWDSTSNCWDWQDQNCSTISGSVLLGTVSITTASPTPEPASLAMMGAMGLGILLLPRKKNLRV